jgi:hypothetical protein
MNLTPKICAAATCAALLFTGSAHAASVDLDLTGGNAFGDPNWSQSVTRVIGSTTTTLSSGMFRLTDGFEDILAFCIEPGIALDLEQNFDTEAVVAPWAGVFSEIESLINTSFSSVVDEATAAGFQMALWEITSETLGPNDLTNGTTFFKASGEALSAGQMFLDNLGGPSTGEYQITTYVNDGQDLVGIAPVPLPASLGFLAAAVGGLGLVKRRRKTA